MKKYAESSKRKKKVSRMNNIQNQIMVIIVSAYSFTLTVKCIIQSVIQIPKAIFTP